MLTQFGKEFRSLRIERGLLLGDVADLIGESPSTVSLAERDHDTAERLIERIADALKLTKSDRIMLLATLRFSKAVEQ